MGELVQAIFSTFGEVMSGLAGGLSDGFSRLIYVYDAQGAVTDEFNPLILFIFTIAGISLAAGVLWGLFAMIKGASHRAG